MNDKLDELHFIYKIIGKCGFNTVQELLDSYDKLQQKNKELKELKDKLGKLKEYLNEKVNICCLFSDYTSMETFQLVLDKIKELEGGIDNEN